MIWYPCDKLSTSSTLFVASVPPYTVSGFVSKLCDGVSGVQYKEGLSKPASFPTSAATPKVKVSKSSCIKSPVIGTLITPELFPSGIKSSPDVCVKSFVLSAVTLPVE